MPQDGKNSLLNRYILYFFIYSFAGWLLETVYAYVVLIKRSALDCIYQPVGIEIKSRACRCQQADHCNQQILQRAPFFAAIAF